MQIGIWAKRKNKRAKKKGCKKNGYKMREFFVIRFSLFCFCLKRLKSQECRIS